jgi:putative ABC transport system ATP-binding protein
VGRGGWLHVPEELLAVAGIADRATVRATEDGVLLQRTGGDAPQMAASPAQDAAPAATVSGVRATAEAVTKRYGRRTVFTELSATFAPATFTAVSGRSGSGKSTLLRLLAGLELPDAGRVLVVDVVLGDHDRDGLAAVRARHVGVVAQEPQLLAFLTAAEQAAFAASDQQARTWLAAVGLTERAEQRVGRLSAGERQRVAIARALAGGRGLLLVDEPTSRLDEANAAAVAELLHRAAHVHGAAVVCATHDPIVIEAADTELSLDPAATG